MMRILTGKARSVKLNTLEGLNTRPTSERTKEAVFSMIQFDIEGREVLDLYAGSGQMGLEAVSRGAAMATFVDNSKQAVAVITKNIEKTKLNENCKVFNSDVKDYIRVVKGKKKYDVVFIDPPYALCAVPDVLKALSESQLLKPTSLIICESAESDIFESAPELLSRFTVIKKAKYGVANITIVKPSEAK